MRFTAAKWFLTFVLSTTAFGLASASNEAVACFRGLFGCCGGGGGYAAYYGPRQGTCGPVGCGTAGCGTTYYGQVYGPVGWGRCSPCGPVCSPCDSGCSPCGTVACGPCDSGNCSAGAPSNPTPIPNDQWDPKKNKTYADPPTPGDTGTGSDASSRRTDPDAGSNDSDQPGQLQKDDEENFKPVNKAADSGTSSTGGDSATKGRGPASSKGGKKGPITPKIDEDGQGAGKAPAISIDEKVAWRSAPIRTRIETRPHVASARLVRLPAYPKSDWLPVETESKVANRK